MKKTYTLAFTSILFWSTIATVSKLLLGTMSSYKVLCISSLFALLALGIILLVKKKAYLFKEYKLKDYLIMTAIGLPGTFFYNAFLYAGTSLMPASQAFIIMV